LCCFSSVQCSFSVCNRRREENIKKVNEFADSWKARYGTLISCHYDTTNDRRVIVDKTYTQRDVIHSMMWPSVVVIACGLVFLRLKTRRHRLTFCGRRPASTDEIIDLVKRGAAAAVAVGGGAGRLGGGPRIRRHDTTDGAEYDPGVGGGGGVIAGIGKHAVVDDDRRRVDFAAVGKRHSIGNDLGFADNAIGDRRAILLSSSLLPPLSLVKCVSDDIDSDGRLGAERPNFRGRRRSSDVQNASDVAGAPPLAGVAECGVGDRCREDVSSMRCGIPDDFPNSSISMPMPPLLLLNESPMMSTAAAPSVSALVLSLEDRQTLASTPRDRGVSHDVSRDSTDAGEI